MGRFIMYNPNPKNSLVGDCTVRAISKTLGQEWDKTYIGLCLQGYIMCDMPSANRVWGAYLRSNGFKRYMISEDLPDDYSVKDFCKDNANGKFLLAMSGHVVSVVNGFYYDSWDCGDEKPIYFWQYEDREEKNEKMEDKK